MIRIPSQLQSTVDLIGRAYPEGVPAEHYLALLAVLGDYLCEENAAIIASFIKGDDAPDLNDVLRSKHASPDTSDVMERLGPAGFSEWAAEE